MARISFTSSAEEIIGKLGGNVFQDSYFGIQLRGLSKPRNPQTQLQQLRRGDFRFLSSSWRYLSDADKATWIAEAGTVPGALRLFIGNNINLILAGIPIISTYSPTTAPPSIPLEIVQLNTTSFTVQATGAVTTIPDKKSLIFFATSLQALTHNFINPAEYQPILFFPAGSDLSSPVEVSAYWIDKYGQLIQGKYLCVKSAIVDTTNGNRTDSPENCATVSIPTTTIFIEPPFSTEFA